MTYKDIDNFVNKFIKKGKYIITLQDIIMHIVPDYDILQGKPPQSVYAFSSRLQKQGRVLSIKQGIFLIQDEKNRSLHISEIYELYYWQIARAVIRDQCGGDYVIGGNKPLEFLMKDMSTPPVLIVFNRNITKNLSLGNGYTLSFRTILKTEDRASHTSKRTRNLFATIKKYSKLIDIDGVDIRLPYQEIALFEALTERTSGDLGTHMVERFLKRPYTYDASVFEEASTWRYIQAINRLRILSKDLGKKDIYELMLTLIAKNGGGVFLPFSS